MKFFFFFLLVGISSAVAQLPFTEQQFIARLKRDGSLPEKILSTRSVVFFPSNMTTKELESIQKSFQRTGVDAVAYFDIDYLSAGRDASVALAEHLNQREITNIVIFQKEELQYKLYITAYNRKANLTEQDQMCWTAQNKSLDQLLLQVYRTAANSFKNENFLINDFPETDFSISTIDGVRNEYFAIDLKVDALAVPKFGNDEMDKKLEEIMKAYPYKYTITEANLSESELRKQGYLYVLRFVHAKNKVARNLLGYETTRAQSAFVSMAFEDNEAEVKNISASEQVYKFYFKHIESKNVFLGRKWDADPAWEQALWNQLKGYKAEFRLN